MSEYDKTVVIQYVDSERDDDVVEGANGTTTKDGVLLVFTADKVFKFNLQHVLTWEEDRHD